GRLRVSPCGEAASHVEGLTACELEDARREARTDTPRAVDDDPPPGKLACALAHLGIGHVDRAGRVAVAPLADLADVEQHRAFLRARRGGPRIDLLDAQDLAVVGLRRGVSADVVVPDDRELRAQALGLLD